MERRRIQGQNKLCFLDSKVNVRRSLEVVQGGSLEKDQSFVLGEQEQFSTKFPFLQMLQQQSQEESLCFKDPNFLALLSFQTLEKPWKIENYHLPQDEFHSPIHYYQNPSLEGGGVGGVNEAISSQELPVNPADSRRKRRNNNNLPLATSMSKEKRKRKRTQPTKNVEEMENQRMTHIAVERNRRRQMNVHLNSLRSIIPPSYIQRGDQASIVGGAIDFVKILEQHLQSLETQKIDKTNLRDISSNKLCAMKEEEEQSNEPRIDVTVIESHVNLKIQCRKKQGQLLRSIVLLEKFRFTVLHLNITSPSNISVSYSFNLKMEEDCNLGSADEITAMVRQIFD